MNPAKAALIIVDTQNYYLDPGSPFCSYAASQWAGSLGYIHKRVPRMLKAIQNALVAFRVEQQHVCYLRLCSDRPDRSDLHAHFRRYYEKALAAGYPGAYPLAGERYADMPQEICPLPQDCIIDKRVYSGFSEPRLDAWLKAHEVRCLVMAGLATSQCVSNTARAGSDLGYDIIFLEDALTDYSRDAHEAALYASAGVCGGNIFSTEDFCKDIQGHIAKAASS